MPEAALTAIASGGDWLNGVVAWKVTVPQRQMDWWSLHVIRGQYVVRAGELLLVERTDVYLPDGDDIALSGTNFRRVVSITRQDAKVIAQNWEAKLQETTRQAMCNYFASAAETGQDPLQFIVNEGDCDQPDCIRDKAIQAQVRLMVNDAVEDLQAQQIRLTEEITADSYRAVIYPSVLPKPIEIRYKPLSPSWRWEWTIRFAPDEAEVISGVNPDASNVADAICNRLGDWIYHHGSVGADV